MFIAPMPLAETVAALRSGEMSLAGYITGACDRADAVEGEIGALVPEVGRRERLLRETATLEAAYPEPATRPPLYGALVGVKDIIRVEGFTTGAGTQLPPDLFAGPEAAVVRLLKAAGALVLGKTVTTEFAGAAPNGTRNPHNRAHTPGGSSSGSAAAVAAGVCALALGTQTVGSVIRPAAFCGIVGFKPSYDRIPTEGIVYYSQSVDTIGLFTQDVAGIALAASVLCENWHPAQPDHLPTLGVPEGPYLAALSDEGRAALESQLARLEAAGYTVRRVSAFADFAAITARHTRMASAEAASVHTDWFPAHEPLYRPQTAAVIRTGRAVSADDLAAARASRGQLRDTLHALMAARSIDLWACPPATGPAPEGIDYTGDPTMNLPWSHAGLPALALPARFAANGLPLGLQLVAPFHHDEALLAWADNIAATLGSIDG